MPSKDYINMIKSDMEEPTPLPEQTKKDKAKNFWLYHRIFFAVGAIAVAVLGFFIYDIVTQVHPDVQFAYITGRGTIPTEVTEALQNDLSVYIEDINGDGQTVAMLNVYNIANTDTADPYTQMAAVTRMSADMSEMMSYIYLTDDFDTMQDQYEIFANLFDPIMVAESAEQAGFHLYETNLTPTGEFSEEWMQELYDELYQEIVITTRVISADEDKEERLETIAVGQEVFGEIVY